MAEAAINRFFPSGYDEDFVVPPDEDLHCIICQLPSKEPVLTRCGHRFCRECLEEHLRRQEQESCQMTCPTDRKVLERNKDIFPDKLIERKILSLLIKCPSEGCEWNGELRAKKDHLFFCIFQAVSCTNESCKEKVPRKDLTEHVTTKCQWRTVNCDYCEEHLPQCQMENHLETCEGLLIDCPNKCGTRITSEMIPNHVENSCPLTKVTCPYTWIGCNSEIQRDELESHIQCKTQQHLNLACCKLNNVQDEVKSLEEMVTFIERQHQLKVSNLKNQLEERVKVHENQLEERVNTQIGEINQRLNHNNNKVKKEVLFFCLAVYFAIVSALLGIAIQAVQSHSETKMEKVEKSFEGQVSNVQNQLEKKVDEVHREMDSLNSKLGNKIMLLNAFEKQVNNVQNQLEKKVDDVQKKVDSLNTTLGNHKIVLLNAFKKQVNNVQNQLEKKVDDVQKKMDSLNTTLGNHEIMLLKAFKKQVNNVQNQFEKKVDEVHKKMDSLNTKLGNKIMLLYAAEPYTFTWKIKNFENVLIQAKSGRQVRIESEPFHIYGYKFKLQLCPNGNGDGQNSHLSLFIIVMKGENDAILAWPFQKKFKFTLIDQQENPAERKNLISEFTPKGTHVEYFAKPIANENSALACQKFVSHKELWTRRFVVDDVIFIQFQVGPPS